MSPWLLRTTTTLDWGPSALPWAGLTDHGACPLVRVLQRQPVALRIKSKTYGAFLSEMRLCVNESLVYTVFKEQWLWLHC